MGFTAKQTQALQRSLSSRRIRTREANGRELSYIEGWYAISEANRIFGFDAWSRDIALKAAETDATKRALATFGRPFGLSSIARIRILSRQARQYLRQRQWRARQPSRASVYTRTIQLQFQGPHTTTAGATMAP